MSWVTVKMPGAPEPLACMRRSGITSRAKCASFSISQTSCNSAGPRGPAVWMFKLSVTGVPDAWARGGRLGWSFMGCSCGLLLLLSQRRPLTEPRLRETGLESKCILPRRNDFGSIAVIAPVLRQSSEAGSYSAATAQCFNHARLVRRSLGREIAQGGPGQALTLHSRVQGTKPPRARSRFAAESGEMRVEWPCRSAILRNGRSSLRRQIARILDLCVPRSCLSEIHQFPDGAIFETLHRHVPLELLDRDLAVKRW